MDAEDGCAGVALIYDADFLDTDLLHTRLMSLQDCLQNVVSGACVLSAILTDISVVVFHCFPVQEDFCNPFTTATVRMKYPKSTVPTSTSILMCLHVTIAYRALEDHNVLTCHNGSERVNTDLTLNL